MVEDAAAKVPFLAAAGPIMSSLLYFLSALWVLLDHEEGTCKFV